MVWKPRDKTPPVNSIRAAEAAWWALLSCLPSFSLAGCKMVHNQDLFLSVLNPLSAQGECGYSTERCREGHQCCVCDLLQVGPNAGPWHLPVLTSSGSDGGDLSVRGTSGSLKEFPARKLLHVAFCVFWGSRLWDLASRRMKGGNIWPGFSGKPPASFWQSKHADEKLSVCFYCSVLYFKAILCPWIVLNYLGKPAQIILTHYLWYSKVSF